MGSLEKGKGKMWNVKGGEESLVVSILLLVSWSELIRNLFSSLFMPFVNCISVNSKQNYFQ
jgi:hypothetical protein